MRILALTNLYPNPFQPNRAPFNRQQFRALAADHQVQVIAPIAWTNELLARSRRKQGAGLAPDRMRIADGMVIRHPSYLFTPRLLRGCYGRFFLHSVRRCFFRAVEELQPDVVLGCWAYPDGWAAVKLAREVGLPTAIKVHGSDVLVAGERSDRRRQTVEALAGADAVIAVSQDLRTKTTALGVDPARVHVVYNGIDDRLFFPGPRQVARQRLNLSPSDPLILFVGNLVAVKGIDVLIDALASLVRDGVSFQCILLGEGPLRSRLQARTARLELAERVRFVGARPLHELPDWYRAADLLVLPSRSEGLPNVLLEAAACGTPFIASRVGGIPEIAHPDSLAPPGEAAPLANRIRAALTDRSNARPALSHPGSWADSARSLANVLQGIRPANPVQLSRAG